MEELKKRRPPQEHTKLLLDISREFHAQMHQECLKALLDRDKRVVSFAQRERANGLRQLQNAGVLLPPWLSWKGAVGASIQELAAQLDGSRDDRAGLLRSNIVRGATSLAVQTQFSTPEALAHPSVAHVISPKDAFALSQGKVLVCDPTPALLAPHMFREAMADLFEQVRNGMVIASTNPCNTGSFHGFVPLVSAADSPFKPATQELLAKLAALPALISAAWPRKLRIPSMAQLGYYPGDGVAYYRPHLDRQPHEVDNRREITFLVYVNCDWDARRCGGHLRLHPSEYDPARPLAPTEKVDIEPIAGRLVVFASGHQLHEVMASRHAGRIALTLWVEYEG